MPPSPTPRVARSVATPIGSSNIGFIMQQGTLVIGWVGPALFGILFAAFAWATGVFQWLWALATWLFSGAWRGGGRCESVSRANVRVYPHAVTGKVHK